MKAISHIPSTLLLFLIVLLNSCSPVNFYQVYKVTPDTQLKSEANSIYYEDANCIIYYDLWAKGGDVSFKFYNKSDKTIEILMDESYFVLNDEAIDYYKNRVFTESRFAGSSSSSSFGYSSLNLGNSSAGALIASGIGVANTKNSVSGKGQATSYVENKVISIPSHTFKRIEGYAINNDLIRDCKLLKYPSKGAGSSKIYEEANSPLVFTNIIKYNTEGVAAPVIIKNHFYVSEISNFTENEITGRRYDEFCGQKSQLKVKYIKIKSPEKFYNRYKSTGDFWKH
jgi:hypothetical protein